MNELMTMAVIMIVFRVISAIFGVWFRGDRSNDYRRDR